MKISVNELLSISRALVELAQFPIPINKAFQVAQLQQSCDNSLAPIEKVRQSLLERFGTRDISGNFTIPTESQVSFNVEVNKMLAIEVELPDVKIDLTECTDIKIKPAILFTLSKIVEFNSAL